MKFRGKIIRMAALAGMVLAVMSLSSCASVKSTWADVKTEYALLRQEWHEIREFFSGGEGSTEPSQYAVIDATDSSVSPMLGMTPHTEILRSPYNRVNGIATLKSVGETANGLTDGGGVLSDKEKYGYTKLPYFTDYGKDAVLSALQSVGIAADVVVAANPAPAGEVFAISYAGVSDEAGFYINPPVGVTVFVSDKKPAKTSNVGENLVYLTFDDGPSKEGTQALLDILDIYGVKATFFTLGTAIEEHPEIAANIAQRGHLLGCHSFTHVYEDIYSSQSALENEVILWEKAVAAAGVELTDKLFRFPGGSVGGKLELSQIDTMMEMLTWHRYRVFDWGVSINDAVLYMAEDEVGSYDYIKESFTSSLEQRVKINSRAGGGPIIILMHENVQETVDLLPWIIEYLIEEGYTFGELSDLDSSWMFERDMK